MNKDLLLQMLSTPSVSGRETTLGKTLYDYAGTFAHQVRTDEIGDVIAVLNPESPLRVLLSGHMDEIGLMVTAVTEDGFLKVTRIGGIRTSTYLGHKVRVHTAQGVLYGSVAFTTDLAKKSDLHTDDLTVDIGAKDKADALAHVALGDTVTFDTDCRELLNNRICGRGMDNRTGAFIALEAVRRAAELGCKIGAYGAATAGEETTMNGAYFVASRVQPTLAIAVDVTFTSDYPGVSIATTGDVRVGGRPRAGEQPLLPPEDPGPAAQCRGGAGHPRAGGGRQRPHRHRRRRDPQDRPGRALLPGEHPPAVHAHPGGAGQPHRY